MQENRWKVVAAIIALTIMTLINGTALYRAMFPGGASPTITNPADDPMEVAYQREAGLSTEARAVEADLYKKAHAASGSAVNGQPEGYLLKTSQ